jgi:hypothetical protein
MSSVSYMTPAASSSLPSRHRMLSVDNFDYEQFNKVPLNFLYGAELVIIHIYTVDPRTRH